MKQDRPRILAQILIRSSGKFLIVNIFNVTQEYRILALWILM